MSTEIQHEHEHENSEDNEGGKSVIFEHVNSLKEVKLHAGKTETLSQLWGEAYTKLKEPRREGDRLQTDSGKDLMPFLTLTLHQLHEQQGIITRKFEIVGPTGGA